MKKKQKIQCIKNCLIARLIFILPLLVTIISPSICQNQHSSCGVYVKAESENNDVSEVVALDRFGNQYTAKEMDLNQNSSSRQMACTQPNGVFDLVLVGDFEPDEEETICSVFVYLANVIGSSVAPIRLNIFMDETIPTGIDGVGSGYYHPLSCGIQHPMAWEKRNAGISNPFNPIAVDGYLRINANSNWHTLDDDPAPIPSSSVDLYSLVLHEAVHALGFNSFITDDGTPLFESEDGNGNPTFGFYTAYDKLIYSQSESEYLISQILNPVPEYCCDEHEFNPNTNLTILPNATGGCNDLVFDQQADIPVNQYFVPSTSTFNSLSHLDEDCNTSVPYFVMHYGSASGEESRRRVLQAQELEILCKLGMRDNCDDGDCILVATDDIVIYETNFDNNQHIIPLTDIFANDVLGSGTLSGSSFDIIQDCGNVSPSNYQVNMGNLILNGLPYGDFVLCYTISHPFSLCPDVCDQAYIFIQHNLSPILPILPPCPEINCSENLFCYGNFNDLAPIPDGVFSNTEVPYFMQTGYTFCEQTNTNSNTPDILYLGGDERAVGLFTFITGNPNRESIYFPLSTAIQPGCKAHITFNATSTQGSQLFIFGSKEPPCTLGLLPGTCTNTSEFSCMNQNGVPEQITSLYSNSTQTFVSYNEPNYPLTFIPESVLSGINRKDDVINNYQLVDYEWTNNTNEPVHFVSITQTPISGSNAYLALDDISITTICDNEVTLELQNPPSNICLNGTVDLEYLLCFEGTGMDDVNVVLTPSAIPEEFAPIFGGDFSTGSFEVEFTPTVPEVCTTLTLSVNMSPGNLAVIPGNQLEIVMDVLAENTCVDGSSDLSIVLDVINDDPNAAFTFNIPPCSSTISFTSDFPDGDHIWTVEVAGTGNVVQSSSDPNPVLELPGSNTYLVTHVVTNVCGSDLVTETIVIDITGACETACGCGTATLIIGAHNQEIALSDFQTPNGPFPVTPVSQPVDVIIRGTLVIDQQQYELFEGSNICMDAGAEIKIPANSGLRINSSTIQGCKNMWKGIKVEGLGNLSILGTSANPSTIDDAEFAIKLESGSSLEAKGTVFDRNYIGIYADGIVFQPEELSGCEFTCDDCESIGLKPTYNGQTTSPIDRTRYGILLENAGLFEIGSQTADANLFDGPVNGIVSINTHLQVVNSNFYNMQDHNIYAGLENYGIFAKGIDHEFWQKNTPECTFNSNCNFDNCWIGISLDKMNAFVTGNSMTNVYFGITVKNSVGKNVNVCNNDIECDYSGIALFNNDNSDEIYVAYNNIDLNWQGPGIANGFAIRVLENLIEHESAQVVNNLSIDITNASRGILVYMQMGLK